MLYYLYKIAIFIAQKLPLRAGYKVAVFCADVYYLFARSDRGNLEENLKIALASNDTNVIDRHTKNIFRNFAKYLVDFFRFSMLPRDYLLRNVTIEGRVNVDKAIANGKGLILLSAHLGNWELGGGIIASLGYPFYAIALDHKDKRINDFFVKQRALIDVKIISIGAQLKNCFKVLRNNHILGIVGDRDFSNHGITANFFGRPTILPKGPAAFSMRTGAPIIPCFSIRTPEDRFKFIFEKAIDAVSTGNEEADMQSIIEQYAAVIERYIKSFPDQWYAFRKVWD